MRRRFLLSSFFSLLVAPLAFAVDPSGRRKGHRPRLAKPRIAPVDTAKMAAEQQKILAPYERSGRIYNVFTTMANHPDLARDWLTFATHILRNSTLPARDREILILRIGWLCDSEYEFAQHARIAKNIGMNDDDLRHIAAGPQATGLSEHERYLLTAADELHADSFLTDGTWNALAKTYDTRQMMDVVFTVGQYTMVSMALNSFGVQLDEGLPGFSELPTG